MKLETFGWNSVFEAHFTPYRAQGMLPGRVSVQHRDRYILSTEEGEYSGQVSGKFRFDAAGLHAFPAVGDWVAFEPGSADQPAIIHAVLERKSKFSRKVAGDRPDEQIIVANIDFVFLVMGLDGNYNIPRLERYLTAATECSAQTVIILNKSDLCPILEECTREVLSVTKGMDIIVMSALHTEDIAPIQALLTPGMTGVLLGSSGVGKSTIINLLLDKEHVQVQEVRANDSHGRHTTAHRELFVLPGGGMIIDTPGLRELQFLGINDGLQESFDDVEALASNCRFRDCKHEAEPGCAVKTAIENGTLLPERYESFQKLQYEISNQAAKQMDASQRLEKGRQKKLSKRVTTKFRSRPH